VTTLSFDIAVLELLLPLSVGAQVLLASREDAMSGSALRALLEGSGVTVMQATPGTWHMLIDAGWQGTPAFKALVGGESLPAELANQLLERSGQLWNMYGPTETTVWSTCCRVEHPELGISIGRPIANTQVHILDAQSRTCPIGVAGEIVIGGDGVALGYLHRPELSAERFIGDPFDPAGQRRMYRTGDRGRWRGDGMLEHMGRLDSQVKVRGHRIELGEIEANVLTHPQVAQVVVIVREDSPGDQRLVSYVVPRGAVPSTVELREYLRDVLPQYMLPQHVVRIDAIPRLPNGKIDRRGLPHPGAGPTDRVLTAGRPLTAVEAAIAGSWEELLGIEGVQVADNFFDLGGHSLLAMRAVANIERRLGVRIDVRRLIFESLGQLAASTGEPVAHGGRQTARKKGMLDRLMDSLRARSRAE
jgi:acyl-CoA synthetase (AMP-forming)/AMP-acid ligase II/acyl carrier protein